MLTYKGMAVIAILLLIFVVAAWSKLRIVDDEDFAPQRVPVADHPAFKKTS